MPKKAGLLYIAASVYNGTTYGGYSQMKSWKIITGFSGDMLLTDEFLFYGDQSECGTHSRAYG